MAVPSKAKKSRVFASNTPRPKHVYVRKLAQYQRLGFAESKTASNGPKLSEREAKLRKISQLINALDEETMKSAPQSVRNRIIQERIAQKNVKRRMKLLSTDAGRIVYLQELLKFSKDRETFSRRLLKLSENALNSKDTYLRRFLFEIAVRIDQRGFSTVKRELTLELERKLVELKEKIKMQNVAQGQNAASNRAAQRTQTTQDFSFEQSYLKRYGNLTTQEIDGVVKFESAKAKKDYAGAVKALQGLRFRVDEGLNYAETLEKQGDSLKAGLVLVDLSMREKPTVSKLFTSEAERIADRSERSGTKKGVFAALKIRRRLAFLKR